MKKVYFIILALILCFSPVVTIGQSIDNNLYYLHGLYGVNSDWNGVIDNETTSHCIGYDSNMSGGIRAIGDYILENNNFPSNSILVGYSAGGLISRYISANNNNVIGTITLATPNNGAGIVKSLAENSYVNILDNVIDRTENAISSTISALSALTFPLLSIVTIILEPIIQRELSGLFQDIKTQISSELDRFIDEEYLSVPLVQDMHPESSIIDTLSSSSKPVFSIAAVEDPDVLYRLLGSAYNGDDESLITNQGLIRNIQSGIISFINYHNFAYDASKWIALIYPQLWITRSSILTSRNRWSLLERYINIDIHTEWAEQIGSYVQEERLIRFPIYDTSIDGGSGGTNDGNQPSYGEVGGIIGYYEELRLVNVNYPNDGLVGTNSALYGNRTTVVEGLNHLELLDSDGLHNTLDSLIRKMSLMRPIVFPFK